MTLMRRRDVKGVQTVDLEGLPEPFVQALKAIVQTLRDQLREIRTEAKHRPKVNLPVWRGKVIGDLTRSQIYEDVG